MHTNRTHSRIALGVGILGVAFLLSAGPLADAAEAHRRHRAPKVVYRQQHVRHHKAKIVYRDCAPRPARVYRYVEPVRCYQPWYDAAPHVVVASSPYYFHAGLNVYLGGVNLNFDFHDPAPQDYVYLDPYCEMQFATVGDYHRHLRRHDHAAALEVVFLGR